MANYHKSHQSSKARDRAYDGGRLGAPMSVYSPQCVIQIKREIGPCRSCRNVKQIVNGYCALCRGNGANEAQCKNPKGIM